MWMSFLEHNFFPVFSLLCLLVFFIFNPMLEKRYTNYFVINIFIIFVIIACEFGVTYFEQEQFVGQAPNILHFISTSVAYSLRPIVMLFVGFMSIKLGTKGKILLSIPAFVNIVICTISIFIPIVFSFNEKNVFVRGTLGFLPHCVGLFYMLVFLVHSFVSIGKGKKSTIFILFLLIFSIGGTLALDTFTTTKLLTTGMALSLLLYYMYLLAINYRVDSLTGAYSRKVFYIDSEKKKDDIVAVMLLDLNGLKLLNDGKGHKEGDLALKTICNCCSKCLKGENKIYRIGGDEFVILCINYPRDEVRPLSYEIIESVAETPYRVSLGLAFLQNGETIDSAIQRADVEMYADKMRFRQDNLEK